MQGKGARGNKLNTKVSFFKNVTDTRPGVANLYDLLTTDTYAEQVVKVRDTANAEQQKRLKLKMPCFTVSGLFSSSGANSIIKHTGLVCIDIDKKDNTEVANFDTLKESIGAIPYILYCGLSVRGEGYFCIIAISDPDRFEEHFKSLSDDFARCGLIVDNGCRDISRKRFVSFDPDAYINLNAETYGFIIKRKPQCLPRKYTGCTKRVRGESANDVEAVIRMIVKQGVDITGDYHQWRQIACALANEFGESGRGMFHEVSQFGEYDPEYTDIKYSDAVKCRHPYGIGTFFHFAKLAGIEPRGCGDHVDPYEAFKEYLK